MNSIINKFTLMIIPVRCPCGRCIGIVADAFKLKRQKLVTEKLKKAKKEVRSDMANIIAEMNPGFNSDLKAELGVFIRESLKLPLECCATTLLSTVEFKSLY